MEKISPLRASLKAFEQFKAQRTQKKQENTGIGATNPFGLTFKGTVLQMDVFETQAKNNAKSNISSNAKETLAKAGKLTASAWAATLSRLNSIKQSMISFGNRLKENTVSTWDKLNKTEISFTGLFSNSVSSLRSRSVSELESMLQNELAAI